MSARFGKELIQCFYPDDIKCIICGREIVPNRFGTCKNCSFELNTNYCVRCGRHKVGMGDYCGDCAGQVLYFDEARSAVNYVDNAQKAVWRLKYGSARYLARALSEYMLDTLIYTGWDVDCFTFVPMDKKRLKKRGYNQSLLLAAELSEFTGKPYLPLLEKTRSTPNQAKLDRAARMENLDGAFSTNVKVPDHVVLADDVFTTGATANECAKALKKGGAKVVYVLTFASVPEVATTDKPTVNIRDFRGIKT